MTRKALIAGSFDPITNGHIDLIQRTARLFGEVYVAVGQNPNKKCLFDVHQRKAFITNALSEYSNIIIVDFTGLLSEFAYSLNVDCIVRGIRNPVDYESEKTLFSVNKLNKGIETLFMPCSDEFTSVSSSMVKAIVNESGFVHQYVPLEVKAALEHTLLSRTYIGITGGSGSGKSTICDTLIKYNDSDLERTRPTFQHIDLDKLVHEMYESNEPYAMACKEKMGLYFGNDIFNDDMTINRPALGKLVFSSPRELAILTELIKKPVRHKFYELVKKSDALNIIVDGATIIESGFTELMNNRCIILSCDEDIVLERIMKRDNISLSDAKVRITSQSSPTFKTNLLTESIQKHKFGQSFDLNNDDGVDLIGLINDIMKLS